MQETIPETPPRSARADRTRPRNRRPCRHRPPRRRRPSATASAAPAGDRVAAAPGYLDDTQYADTRAAAEATLVPGLEFSLRQALDYVGNHIVLTICAPIVLIESFLGPERRLRPWLGRPGLAVVGVLYLLGSLLIFSDGSGRKGFLASPFQLAFAAVVVLVLVAVALLPRWRRAHPRRARRVPHPLWVGLPVVLVRFGADLTPDWAGVAIALALAAAAGGLIAYLSSGVRWGQRHVLVAGTAGLAAAAAFAYLVPPYPPASPAAALAGDVAVTVITVALLGGAWWRSREGRRPAITLAATPL
ncbi:hypothetical protein [Micromonospora sp. NPDC047187]|uniref:hypothetical protein n=1 Tax=Micromonospora sp. NPDC047187 TaxID=3155262 RepID=UPI0033FF0A91